MYMFVCSCMILLMGTSQNNPSKVVKCMGSNDCTVFVSKELEIKEKRNGERRQKKGEGQGKKRKSLEFLFLLYDLLLTTYVHTL